MPIKNLTDRGLAFPEIGQIRKGAPKDEQGRLGKDLQYFRVTFDEAEEEASKTFLKKYGDTPKEINILLPFNDINACWDAWLEAYTAGRMVARSDGEKFEYLIDTETGEVKVKNGSPVIAYKEGMSVGSYQDSKGKTQQIYCKATGRLKVVIPELQRLAYVTVLTSSKHDIANLDAQMNALKQVNNEIIAGIPMVLRRRPKKISTPKPDGTKARYTKWMLSIEADPEWVKRKLIDFKHLALPGNGLELLPEDAESIEIEEIDLTDEDIIEEESEKPEEITRPGRPYPATIVRDKIKDLAANEFKDEKPTRGQIGLVVAMLDQCFAGDGDSTGKRHEVCQYLTGKGSTKDIPGPYIPAILKWLDGQKDSGGLQTVGEFVTAEANNILVARLKELGQATLI